MGRVFLAKQDGSIVQNHAARFTPDEQGEIQASSSRFCKKPNDDATNMSRAEASVWMLRRLRFSSLLYIVTMSNAI